MIINEISNVSKNTWDKLLDTTVSTEYNTSNLKRTNMITVNIRTVITIDEVDHPVVFQFPILIKGWELDTDGYIIKIDGKYRFVWSDHGDYYLVPDTVYEEGNSGQIDILSGFIADYKNAIEKTQHALNILNGVTI